MWKSATKSQYLSIYFERDYVRDMGFFEGIILSDGFYSSAGNFCDRKLWNTDGSKCV